jgi:hypothetical protein
VRDLFTARARTFSTIIILSDPGKLILPLYHTNSADVQLGEFYFFFICKSQIQPPRSFQKTKTPSYGIYRRPLLTPDKLIKMIKTLMIATLAVFATSSPAPRTRSVRIPITPRVTVIPRTRGESLRIPRTVTPVTPPRVSADKVTCNHEYFRVQREAMEDDTDVLDSDFVCTLRQLNNRFAVRLSEDH